MVDHLKNHRMLLSLMSFAPLGYVAGSLPSTGYCGGLMSIDYLCHNPLPQGLLPGWHSAIAYHQNLIVPIPMDTWRHQPGRRDRSPYKSVIVLRCRLSMVYTNCSLSLSSQNLY